MPPTWHTDVDYLKLVDSLGGSVPTGAGVPISLVEAADGSDAYFPDPGNSEFNDTGDPLSTAVNFIDGSGGQANGNSSHSRGQAQHFFGNTFSTAPAANEVTVYEANDYLDRILKSGGTFSNTDPPLPQDFRVQNFSWVGGVNNGNADLEALRRFDFVINRDNITAFVGLSANSSIISLPNLLSHSYNAIAVGRSDGIHATGLTHLTNYGVGRSKPDIVAPRTSTSGATSSTSSVATMLHSTSFVQGTDAANSEVVKAMLLAGATKDEFASWSQFDGSNTWHPLDDTFGAGELNAYNSYVIAASGQATGSTVAPTIVDRHGWDYQSVDSDNKLLYDFVIPAGSTATELSIILTWNAITSSPFHTGIPELADLNLELVDSLDAPVDFNLGDGHVDGLSDSTVDNVEHIYLTDLAAGTYTLKVSSNDSSPTDFGLAWRTATLFDTPSADFDEDGNVDGADFLAWQRGINTLINATHAQGDADGDGDVDGDDLAVFLGTYGTTAPPPALTATAVPEPSTWGLLGFGLLTLLAARSWRTSAAG